MKEGRAFWIFYLSGLFLLGLGYIAILPPFEGFDENSHYSSIREIASTLKLPLYGTTTLDAMIADYAKNEPMPYGTFQPPFDKNMTYYRFFQNPAQIRDYRQDYQRTSVAQTYMKSTDLSWEAIHAPLYYLLLAPLERASDSLSMIGQILLLRTVSFLFVIAGVALSMHTADISRNEVAKGFMLYPLLFPTFFIEFGRMGNDSLCMLISAILAFLFYFYREERDNKWLSLLIGLTLGMGLLTKVFFIPIGAGVVLWMLIAYAWKARDLRVRKQHIINILIICVSALVIGGQWYIGRLLDGIPIVGFNEPQMLAEQGGLIAGLKKHFTLHGLIEGLAVNLVTWIWNGTWSLVHIPPLLYIPMLILLFLVLGAFALTLRERQFGDPAWLGVILFCFFAAGFLRHIVISIAISGAGNTPSAYLHILLPWVVLALGIGITRITRYRLAYITLKILVSYAVLFQLTILWFQVALFAGCATKGGDKYYHFPNHSFCFDNITNISENLGVLAWPHLASASFAGGVVCFIIATINMRKPSEQKN